MLRYYFNVTGEPKKKKIIALENAYHGITVAAAALTGLPANHTHFDLPVEHLGILRADSPHYYRGRKDNENEREFCDRIIQNLENLIRKIASLSPLPDNVYLITDGLPTLSDRPARSALVSGRKRIEYFRDAISRLPKQIPINVILFPMEGDPMAAAEFWNLARITNGAFISPSRDWP